ncbi:gluconokinase [Agromyces aurantiacus]|uniref:Gluconokinase n=1 Tax=Agromyces aurantiacus TaxID=165814 RepID=A0ABV9R3F5_9MICO|nr:gluconokinase [Agromyces aurantiacus]MBM7502830.1 gluconokinase [Agromyces aurantiacus]
MARPSARPGVRRVVVMGVSGAGKSTVGEALARRFGTAFVDADDLHPAANVEKMRSGIPLVDADRMPWLDLVGAALAEAPAPGVVVACSALRRAYRDRLRAAAPDVVFVALEGDPVLLAERMGARAGHFMPATLLASQLASYESPAPDERAVRCGIDAPLDDIVATAAAGVDALAA